MAEQFLTAPEFDSLTVELKPGPADPAAAARQLADGGLEGWSVEAVHPSAPWTFDLLPPKDLEVSVKAAWDLTYELRAHPDVHDAEPAFVTTLDNVPDPADVEAVGVSADLRLAVLAEDEDEDADADADEAGFGAESALAGAAPEGPASLDEDDPEWSPKLVQAPEAWRLTPPAGGAQRGEGIRVAHPDAGFREHAELFSPGDQRVRLDLDRNFVEPDRPDDANHPDGGHGLATASVLMSLDNPFTGPKVVTGAAPGVEIVPMRVAKKRRIVPVPVLLSSGTRRLRDALYAAIEGRCHVVSISLGWVANRSLHAAVKEAVKQDIIVCAAAGNYVRFVVWPAAYPEAIAVAGCTARRKKWRGSSRGRRVDVTAPAKNVWKAAIDKDGRQIVEKSKGTSYSVATTAGLAALWLAFWGRDVLIDRYRGEFTLTTVFRRVLKATCDPPPPRHRGRFGQGIVNAKRLLERTPPTLDEMRASTAPDLESALAAPPVPDGRSLRSFTDLFEAPGAARVPEALGAMLEVPVDDLPRQLPAIGDELLFHLVTDPSLRQSLLLDPSEAPVSGAALEGLLVASEAPPAADPRASLLASPALSDRLRAVAG